jgi:hypothetical protein
MTDRAEWKQLAEAATPGPWQVNEALSRAHHRFEDGTRVVTTSDSPGLSLITLWPQRTIGESTRGWDVPEQSPANASFIAAARTAVPTLLSDIEKAEAERDALRAEVERLDDILNRRLNVTTSELIRVQNTCTGVDGDVKIWSRMLSLLIQTLRDARAALKEPSDE